MSATNIDDAIVDTQKMLQPLFSKPKLSSKLLRKPPFRFIHDIVNATLQSTGFPDGLYSEEELDSSNYKDKESKMNFLDKFISLVSLYLNSPLLVRSSKIISGIDSTNTNILLAEFGRAATDSSYDRYKLISRCIRGDRIDTVTTSSHGHSRANLSEGSLKASQLNNNSAIVKEKDIIEQDEIEQSSFTANIKHQIDACNSDYDRTREVLEHIVSKPKCSEKLLRKPPFRFLHDLIMAVNRKTEFCSDVLSGDETNSKNISDKQSKIAFLKKIIKKVELFLDISIQASPKKIVYGMEEETCKFLQLFALAATIYHLNPSKDLSKAPNPNNFDENVIAQNITYTQKDKDLLITTMENEKNSHSHKSNHSESNSDENHSLDNENALQKLAVDEQVRGCNSDPKSTRKMVESLVPRPKCTDKLLSKPPFRFLHDLILAIGKARDFGLDIYSNEELDSSNMKDKSSKLLFLEKMKNHIEVSLNIEIDLSPKKTISGMEADKVCRFIQLLVVAATESHRLTESSSNSILSSVHLGADDPQKSAFISGSSETIQITKEKSGSSALNQTEVPLNGQVEKNVIEIKSQLDDHNNHVKISSIDKSNGAIVESIIVKANNEIDSSIMVAKNDEGLSTNDIGKYPHTHQESPMPANLKIESHTIEVFELTENIEPAANLSNDLSEQILPIEDETNGINNRQQLLSTRPKTARRRPPRTKQDNNVVEAKYKSFSEHKAAVIKDGNDVNDDLGENVEQNDFFINSESISTIKQNNDKSPEEKNRTHQTKSSGIRLHLNIHKSKEKSMTANSIYTSNGFATILQGIQKLAKSTTPLGKSFEYLHDTYGQMVKEEQHWISEYQKYSDELESEKKKTDSTLESLKQKLRIMDDQLIEKRQQVLEMKIHIDARKRKQIKHWREMINSS